MYEKRNFIMILLLMASGGYAFYAWLFMPADTAALGFHRWFPTLLFVALAVWLYYAFRFEDKMPDYLADVVGAVYYDVDGMSFMPIVRVNNKRAELCLYYQNRFDEPSETIVHLRPPRESIIIRPGSTDVHFAFHADGGDFGVIHQPIAIPEHLQGEVIDVQLCAAVRYPRGHGVCLRDRVEGLSCGSFPVDWVGGALKAGVHEVSDEIELTDPAMLHLSLPIDVESTCNPREVWRHEQLQPGKVA